MALDLPLPRAGAPSAHSRAFRHYPWHIAFFALGIAALGLWNLASATHSGQMQTKMSPRVLSQLSSMGFGAATALAIGLVDYRRFMRLAYPCYALVLLLLGAVMFMGSQKMGARRWLTYGPINLQPSELAKVAVALALARWFHMSAARRKEGYGLLELVVPALMTLAPAVLILRQPDLGTALIVVAVGGTMILFAKVRWQALVVVGVMAVAGATIAYPRLHGYQKQRVDTFLKRNEGDPLLTARGPAYHANQSMIAVGSGQGLGRGWGRGTQTALSFLPEQQTDFIFSVWAEEHGFVGCLLILALYYALVVSALGVAGNARDRFGHFLAVGVMAILFWHAFINMAMVTGVLPVVGVTLPLMSYGGSSVMAVFIGLGLLANVGMRRFVN